MASKAYSDFCDLLSLLWLMVMHQEFGSILLVYHLCKHQKISYNYIKIDLTLPKTISGTPGYAKHTLITTKSQNSFFFQQTICLALVQNWPWNLSNLIYKGYLSLIKYPFLAWMLHQERVLFHIVMKCSWTLFELSIVLLFCLLRLFALTGLCWRLLTWGFPYRGRKKLAKAAGIFKWSTDLDNQHSSLIS